MPQDLYALSATLIPVGLSGLIKVNPTAYNFAGNLKILSGGGTLEIVPVPVALTGASATGWGMGYPIGSSEAISISGPAVFYLAATGGTMIATMLIGKSSGATVI